MPRASHKKRRLTLTGRRFIQRFEGLRLVAYKAHASEQYWTIGYGDYGPHVRPGQRITKVDAERRFLERLRPFEAAVNELVTVPLTQGQFTALVSFAFNIGVNGFASSTLLRKLNRHNKKSVSGQLMRWVRAGSAVLTGLVRRRRAEGRRWRKSSSR